MEGFIDETRFDEVVDLVKKSIRKEVATDVWYSRMVCESAFSGVTEAYYMTLVMGRLYNSQNKEV
ncbi:MAG: hypothetical protein KatS3mg104_2973 [Phycisphaerae bacterium]|nr:MAG: hypothetical protein KatS3mg104_2973 [Phycisphaerae bacterium]